jgi:hypothetical protein
MDSQKAKISEKSAPKPRIMLMGDSIRQHYTPLVAKLLENVAEIVQIQDENGKHTKRTEKKLIKWLKRVDGSCLSIIHFNNGLHDLAWHRKKKKSRVPLEKYKKNLCKMIEKFHANSPAKLIFATTTPVLTERHKTINPTYMVWEDLQVEYNNTAKAIMTQEQIPVNDLDSVIRREGVEKCLSQDGVHMTEFGNILLARTVAEFLRNHL